MWASFWSFVTAFLTWQQTSPLSFERLAHNPSVLREGIPNGTVCERVFWCDSDNICGRICARGSVQVPHWLQHAFKTQNTLTYSGQFCSSQVLGTHNSAITLADGYGVRDAYFSKLLSAGPGPALHVNTANQLLSLTDQLRLGVRMLEVDVHYVMGQFRIAHCGNTDLDLPGLKGIVSWLDEVYKKQGRQFTWATNLVGCNPSLSSIPADEQRLARDAFREIRQWLDSPDSRGEFIVLYIDTDSNVKNWVRRAATACNRKKPICSCLKLSP